MGLKAKDVNRLLEAAAKIPGASLTAMWKKKPIDWPVHGATGGEGGGGAVVAPRQRPPRRAKDWNECAICARSQSTGSTK